MKTSTGPNHHMKILIVGAGIAGLTTALCLARNGHDLTMIEKSPALRDDGYMIDFFGSADDGAEQLGIIPDLERIRSSQPKAPSTRMICPWDLLREVV